MIHEAVVGVLVLTPSELRKETRVGYYFDVVCCLKGVEGLSGMILEEVWVLV